MGFDQNKKVSQQVHHIPGRNPNFYRKTPPKKVSVMGHYFFLFLDCIYLTVITLVQKGEIRIRNELMALPCRTHTTEYNTLLFLPWGLSKKYLSLLD